MLKLSKLLGLKAIKQNKRQSLKFCLIVLGVCCSTQALAWSKAGHEWIVQSAANQLRPEVLEKYDAFLKEGIVVPPMYFHASIPARLGAVSAWPDEIRGLTLAEIFKKAGTGKVPKALEPWANKTTDNWHYTNHFYVNEKGSLLEEGKCSLKPTGQLLEVWPQLLTAFKQVESGRDKNVILALALHLASDAYQPLHLISAVDKKCEIDRGGNTKCILENPQTKKCETNLHQLWDEGFDQFNQPLSWPNKLHPTNIFSFKDALKEAQNAALDVYPNDGDFRSQAYLKTSQARTATQVGYAVGHCKFLLDYFINQ